MRRTAVYVLAALAAVSCGRGGKPPSPAPSGEAHEDGGHDEAKGGHDEGGEAHAGEAPVVKIDEEMLRDLRVTTAPAEQRPASEGAPVLGELHVDETRYAEVGAPVTARAVRVRATAGQQVRRGDVLAELQSLDVGRARGEQREAAARVQLARQALERKRRLAEERIAPRREVQEAEAELKAAESSLQAAQSSLETMGAGGGSGGSLTLRAPVTGVVIERTLVAGQVTDPSKTLFRVGDLTRLWLVAHAPERDAVRVRAGEAARISIPALPGESFTGRVLSVGSQVEVNSRTIPVRIAIANPTGVLRPGMSASVWLAVGDAKAMVTTVPAAALQRMDDKWVVFIPGEAGTFHVRPVGRGRDLGGEVEIVSGLRAGETVVVEGAFLLKAEAEKARGEGGHHDH